LFQKLSFRMVTFFTDSVVTAKQNKRGGLLKAKLTALDCFHIYFLENLVISKVDLQRYESLHLFLPYSPGTNGRQNFTASWFRQMNTLPRENRARPPLSRYFLPWNLSQKHLFLSHTQEPRSLTQFREPWTFEKQTVSHFYSRALNPPPSNIALRQ